MTGEIVIDFNRSEGAVLRLIGLVERRGFEVTSVTMPEANIGPARLTLGLAPREATRCFNTLTRHVAKVHGVTGVRAAHSHPPFMERAS
jgi:acetolactate synthase II small subunit